MSYQSFRYQLLRYRGFSRSLLQPFFKFDPLTNLSNEDIFLLDFAVILKRPLQNYYRILKKCFLSTTCIMMCFIINNIFLFYCYRVCFSFELKYGSKANFIHNINRLRYIQKMYVLYWYLNHQNTEHECHCIGASMNRTLQQTLMRCKHSFNSLRLKAFIFIKDAYGELQ